MSSREKHEADDLTIEAPVCESMYFTDTLLSPEDVLSYSKVTAQLSEFLLDCVRLPLRAYEISVRRSHGDERRHHASVLMLARLFCEQIDAVAVLTAEGCSEPSKPLVRSAFEASLGVRFILATDSERRGLAYQVAHMHRQLRLCRQLDVTEPAGQEFRETIKDDSLGLAVLDSLPKIDLSAPAARLRSALGAPPLQAIEQEWVRTKKKAKADPAWFALFGGPRSIRALAFHLGKASWYEFLYSDWSDTVHAGSGMKYLAPNTSDDGGPVVIRPLRHPDGLQALVRLAAGMCLELTRLLLATYGNDQDRREMQDDYRARLQERYREVMTRELIMAAWR